MNTAPFVKGQYTPTKSNLGLPLDSQHGIIIGKLFKLHPTFDETLFSILLQSQSNPWYLLFISEKNIDLNQMVYTRWKEKQKQICCINSHNPLRISPCCQHLSFCEMKYYELSTVQYWTNISTQDKELLAERCHNYVLHRFRFVDYSQFLDALMSATVALDTFPYGGSVLLRFILILN